MNIQLNDTTTLLKKGAAISIQQALQSPLGEEEGHRIYPPTFIHEEGYFIDQLPGGGNRAVIDTKQSQARRLAKKLIALNETSDPQSQFLPDVTVSGAGATKRIGEIGHRVGDAAVLLAKEVSKKAQDAIRAYNGGDSTLLATWFPESLLFGFWDSHSLDSIKATNAKRSRIIHSEIHAYGVAMVRSKSMYMAVAPELVGEEEYNEGKGEEKLSTAGLANAPGKLSRDGVVARSVTRSAEINIASLRQLECRKEDKTIDAPKTEAMRAYLLSLAALALLHPDTDELNLRSGTLLVPQPGSAKLQAVLRDGTRADLSVPEDLQGMASAAAKAWFLAATGNSVPPTLHGEIDRGMVAKVRKSLSSKSKKSKSDEAPAEAE